MYKDGPEGLYWFTGGWNFRCIIALFVAMAPCIPGFIWTCIDSTANNAAIQMYQITYFIAAPLAAIVYLTLNWIWPVEVGLKEFLPEQQESNILEGVPADEEAKAGSAELRKRPSSEVKSTQD